MAEEESASVIKSEYLVAAAYPNVIESWQPLCLH